MSKSNGETVVLATRPGVVHPLEALEARVGLLEIQVQRFLEQQAQQAAKGEKIIAAAKSGNPVAILQAIAAL